MKRIPEKLVAALAASAVLSFSVAAVAQSAAPTTRVRGTVSSVSADQMVVKTKDGQTLTVKLPANVAVRDVTLAQPTDIKAGSFIGTAAVPQADGTLRALEVHVFAASLNGSGEGTRPWDLGKHGSMTNGTVGNIVVSNGRTITVKYSNGEKKIVVPNDVPIVAMDVGQRSEIVSGAKVVAMANKGGDGVLTAASVSVGENGITPPM